MTKEQEKIAEHLVERMKQDDAGSIGWVKFADLFSYSHNDVFIAVQGLKDIGVIQEYPNKPSSIRFVSPNGIRFTTFEKYKKENTKKLSEKSPYLDWAIKGLISAAITTVIGLLIALPKFQSSSQKNKQQDTLIHDLNQRIDSILNR